MRARPTRRQRTAPSRPISSGGFSTPRPAYIFFTISEAERGVIDIGFSQFVFEGAAYSAYTDQVEGSTALYRFFNTETGTHFYTASDDERAAVDLGLPEYDYEGIAYYVDII